MEWLNEPPSWSETEDGLTLVTGDQTDFWRETHYGFVHDNGHFAFRRTSGDFTARVTFSAEYEHLYDQAGLMVRLDDRNWVKAGIEYTDGVRHLSVVSTRDFSDWSVMPLADAPAEVGLRVSRHGDALRVEYTLDGTHYRMLRLTYLRPGGEAMVGPMSCSPLRSGLVVTFRDFSVGPPISPNLHEDTP